MEITAGILICASIRDYLREAKFSGMNIDWIESSGWIQRTFTIKGSEKDIAILQSNFSKIIKDS